MSFNSLAFLIFLPIVVGVYWLIPHRLRKYWLLAASYFFYMYFNPILILLLLASTAIDYFCGLGMEKFRDRAALRKALLITSVCANLGILLFFKYSNFFGETVNDICAALSLGYRVPAMDLILPIGISFYTFQTMSYTIDVYRGKFPAERDPVTFALYVTFFPQLVAGPIETPGNLIPQLKQEQRPSAEDFRAGIRQLTSGFFHKCVVADLVGIYVNRVFSNLEGANGLALLLAGFLFCIQIYCDFNGYSEIAAGSARLLGIRLMRNFDRPYLATSPSEYFRRWHISLNRWFTDYVYIPLGGSRKGEARRILNVLIVFSLCGLWHGADWTFVLWGLYSGVTVVLDGLWRKPGAALDRLLRINNENEAVKLVRRVLMMLLNAPGALIFRAQRVGDLGVIFTSLFTKWGFGAGYLSDTFAQLGMGAFQLVSVVLAISAMIMLYNWSVYDLPEAETPTLSAARTVTAVLLITVTAMGWLALLASQEAAGFAYFQF